VEEFRSGIAANGFAMMGQTPEVAPLDKRLYALRDVTATVESIPLITASILSKKIAEGASSLVFDVKYGRGAFMKTRERAEELARSLVDTVTEIGGGKKGRRAAALITNMESPLGRKIGNFLEIEETIECLQGKWPPSETGGARSDVRDLTLALGAEMLILGGKAKNRQQGVAACEEAVNTGKALELFLQNVARQGGDPDQLMGQCGNRRSPHAGVLTAARGGYLGIDAYRVRMAGITLGVGRNRTEDPVCADAGVILLSVEGDLVRKGDPVLEVFGRDEEALKAGMQALEGALIYTPEKRPQGGLIWKTIEGAEQ
jgi:pyrimidine-nucleoside phosphorylase